MRTKVTKVIEVKTFVVLIIVVSTLMAMIGMSIGEKIATDVYETKYDELAIEYVETKQELESIEKEYKDLQVELTKWYNDEETYELSWVDEESGTEISYEKTGEGLFGSDDITKIESSSGLVKMMK